MTQKIFISYSSKDKTIADAVCSALETHGLRCWIAPRDITPGFKYAEAIVDGINGCQVFLLVLSEASNASRQVEMEVERAASKGLPIVSFRVEPVVLSKTMEYYLSSMHRLDASQPPIEKHIQVLVQMVKGLVASAGEGPEADWPLKAGKSKPAPEEPGPARAKTTENSPPPAVITENANPFTFGNPIKDPARFYGRQTDIRQITSRLLSSAHESTSIIGERRIGKTSLLYHLSHPQVSADLGLTPDRFCMVYVDFQGLTDITPTRFWKRVLKKAARTVCDESLIPAMQRLSGQESFDLFDLEDLFEITQDKGLTVVLMMDEFEYVTQNPNFKGDFFGGLRALAIHHGVALLPATRRELVDLCHSDEIKGSPFFNIFANVILRPFSRDEVDEMLKGYSTAGNLGLTPEEKEFIWSLGGGYPFFVQMAGHYLAEGKLQKLAGDDLTKFTGNHFNQQAESHYSYLWSRCSESEKISLLVLLGLSLQKASKKTTPDMENLGRMRPRTPHDLTALGKRGLVAESGGLYTIFSPSFARWIRQEITAAPGEAESPQSAEEWLKAGGSDDIQNARGVLPGFKKRYWPLLKDISKDISINFAAAGVFELVKALLMTAM